MFQYSFQLAMQKNYPDIEIAADLESMIPGQHQGFELTDVFGIKLKLWAPMDVLRGTQPSCTDYCPELFELDTSQNYYLYGYWQNEHYLRRVAGEIFDSFVFPPETEPKNMELRWEIAEANAIGVHVREGDFVIAKFPLCGREYYGKAVKYMEERVDSPRYYVFSDNIEYAKSVFGEMENVRYVNHNKDKQSYRDMQLMSLCKHNITANSTFSFWGAYLNKNPGKHVIAPNKINGTGRMPVACEGWVLLDE
jgi:hypothetical protein